VRACADLGKGGIDIRRAARQHFRHSEGARLAGQVLTDEIREPLKNRATPRYRVPRLFLSLNLQSRDLVGCYKMRIVKIAFIFVLLAVSRPAVAGVILNGDPSLTWAEVDSPGCQCRNADKLDPFDHRQTLCILDGSIDVNVTAAPARVRFEYSIFGNALAHRHDGAGAWIQLSDSDGVNSPHVAMAALPPSGLDGGLDLTIDYGTSNIQSGETVDFVAPVHFTAQIWVAYNASPAAQEWGCRAPKTYRPSWMKILIDQSP
jgi:hypothetical protein